MIIDCHGHYTTAPELHNQWRIDQLAAFKAGKPSPAYPEISDESIIDSVEKNQLRLINERGIDLTIFSPRASAMGHHEGDQRISLEWTVACNNLIKRVVDLFPETFVGVSQLPQSPGADLTESINELERCVNELGFIGCNLNPDPSGGKWETMPLTDKYWYPLYEKMVELDVPAMIHVSASCNPNFHATGAHYMNADTTAFMQLLQGDLFADFPTLRFIIPHGGGAVPYHWGRYRGLADMLKQPALDPHLMNNVFFDTCVYHQPGIDLLLDVIDNKNILFGSEMIGAVRGTDPQTGQYFDDTKRYIDAADISRPEARRHLRQQRPRSLSTPQPDDEGLGPMNTLTFVKDSDWLDWDPTPSKPTFQVPAGAVDAHCHVFGPGSIFPFAPERKYTPCDASREQLFALRDFLGFEKNVVVQATCHGTDNSALLDVLANSNDRARGVVTVKP